MNKKRKDVWKTLKILGLLLVIVFILLLVSVLFLFKPKILGSPGQEVIESGKPYLIVLIVVLSLAFVVLIGMICWKYAKIKKQQVENNQLVKVTKKKEE